MQKNHVPVAAMRNLAWAAGMRSARCMCWQVCRAEQHLRLAANRDWPAQLPCESVRPLSLVGFWLVVEALQGSRHLVLVAAMQSMASGQGMRSARCICWQECQAEQHLRLAANRDRPAQQPS